MTSRRDFLSIATVSSADAKSNFPCSPSANNVVFDYTADGVRRSVEDSLQRLELKRQKLIEQNASTPA